MRHIGFATGARSIHQSAVGETTGAGSAQVLLLIGSGVVAAAQIGKAIITVPLIRSELSLGLDLAGLIVATFATLGAITGIGAGVVVTGIGAGVVVSRLGVRRSLTGGMGAIALGNMIGAGASHEAVLLAARIMLRRILNAPHGR